MKYELAKLAEISTYLGEMDTTSLLNKMQEMLSKGNYVLTVMGQFSVGKSTLINALVGKAVLPVNKTETTAVVTYLKYDTEDHAELVYADGTVKACSIEDTLSLEQNTDTPEQLAQLETINIYLQNDLFKSGLIIADTPGVNTILKEHTEKTVQLFETSSRILYVVSGAMRKFDSEFLQSLQERGLKSLIVRTYMDTIDPYEDDVNQVIAEETKQLSAFTDDPIYFVSSKPGNSFYEKIAELRDYLSRTIAQQAANQLESVVDERAAYIAHKLLPLIGQREQALTAMLDNQTAVYQKQREALEQEADRLKKALERSKEKLQKQYKTLKSSANEGLQAKTNNEIRELSNKIKDKDFTAAFNVHADIEDMLHESCTSLRVAYLSEFDKIIKKNKEEILSELNATDSPVYLNVELPDNMDEAGEAVSDIQAKIDALIALQDELDEEIEDGKKRIAAGDEKRQQIEEQLGVIAGAVDALNQELNEYGEYVEKYRIRRGDHSNEQRMRVIGKIADFATILIPGEAWVNLGGKAAKAVLGGAKVIKDGGKLIKGADVAADVIRGLHMIKKNGMAERNGLALPDHEAESTENCQELQEQMMAAQEQPGILDLLSIEYYCAKLGKKFDQPDVIEVDEEHRARFEEGKKKIAIKIENEARKQADLDIKKYEIEDQQEQEAIYLKELAKRKGEQEKQIQELEKQMEKERLEQINSISADHYIAAVKQYLNEFRSHIAETVIPVVEEKFEAYLSTYGLEIESQIASQRNAMADLEREFASADREKLQGELETCQSYHAALQ